MHARVKVTRLTEFVGTFEGDTLEEIIDQAKFEARTGAAEVIREEAVIEEDSRPEADRYKRPAANILRSLRQERQRRLSFKERLHEASEQASQTYNALQTDANEDTDKGINKDVKPN